MNSKDWFQRQQWSAPTATRAVSPLLLCPSFHCHRIKIWDFEGKKNGEFEKCCHVATLPCQEVHPLIADCAILIVE
jgi:hypothetical protein